MTIKPQATMAQNKLLLLYLLNAGSGKQDGLLLSELQIMRIMEELGFMHYFDLKECLFELLQDRRIKEVVTPRAVLYGITQSGGNIIEALEDDLRLSLRRGVDEYLSRNRGELEKESQFIGEYLKLGENEYRVVLKVLEKSVTIFEVSLIVYSRDEARKIAENWKDNAVAIYKDLILKLAD